MRISGGHFSGKRVYRELTDLLDKNARTGPTTNTSDHNETMAPAISVEGGCRCPAYSGKITDLAWKMRRKPIETKNKPTRILRAVDGRCSIIAGARKLSTISPTMNQMKSPPTKKISSKARSPHPIRGGQ